jgi:arylsulfate sulfotransferase
MQIQRFLAGLALLAGTGRAAVQITSLTPSLPSPQNLGTSITWTVTASDSHPGPLAFQFSVAIPEASLAMARDFNPGTLTGATWRALPFVWTPTASEGIWQIQVIAKDFTSGETASAVAHFQVNPLVTGGTPVVTATANPLVALFSAPACAAGSTMRVAFQPASKSAPPQQTNWANCHPPSSMNFEIAGMYPNTTYNLAAQTNTGGKITYGSPVSFTTGALPSGITFPAFTVQIPAGSQTDRALPVMLASVIQAETPSPYLLLATDLSGAIIWYYYQQNSATHFSLLTRPLHSGAMLTIQDGPAWNPATQWQQTLREIDLAGNILRETNTGIIQQQLLSMGATDGGPCNVFPHPAPVGAACLGAFHHEAMQLPNGDVAVIADIEKIFPAGTQGDTSGLPVDVLGDMIVVLNTNWKVVWYFDAFEHAGGGTQLDINRPAVLGETCTINERGCPPMLLLGTGISPQASDWLHSNSIYYWANDAQGASGDLIYSSRHQDWVMKIDYQNGTGTGDILWRMGPCGDFTFNNINNDPWPWFSHQHDVGMENHGAGPLTVFDNNNTRLAPPSGPGSSRGCLPGLGSGNSRGMALTVDENALQVTPVISVDTGVFSFGMGSAQLLPDGHYFFAPSDVNPATQPPAIRGNALSFSIEILPAPGSTSGSQVLNVEGAQAYRIWRMPNLYTPPLT